MYSIQNSININNKRKFESILLFDNTNILFLNDINSRKMYLKVIKDNLQEILDNTHKHIENYVKYDKNIFDGNLKFNNLSIVLDINIYMAVCCTYSLKTINIKIYLLNNIPHRMKNNEIYFDKYSFIAKTNKIFNILSYQEIGLFNNNLLQVLNNLFDITFYGMIYQK